ncbi:chitinase [Tengunoibacter tsumagoiensis]|uniref:LysM domain-containing protein n=1 Tax=Tengunoibacter tsumagoiensis TaxID=2014871 RepID=A0A401ZUG1_9CHLR|nr:chitinase [Tengunoibacter tsumagoiensis]GCE10555.1 hypothetical protein KTT_04140 [Tengunoibacter tsumagoiensis]
MTCSAGRSYTVQTGDTLFLIAERELGNGQLWTRILHSDGTPFTAATAKTIHAGQTICLPILSPSGSTGLTQIITQSVYESMFPHRNSLYSYAALVQAAQSYPLFCNEGSLEQRTREAAAFFANCGHETTGGWDQAPDGPYAWGLYFLEEQSTILDPYCYHGNSAYPCMPGVTYHGRGPLQLSWNYNYGAAGAALGIDLLKQPDLLTKDGVISFLSALWFWMTPQPPKPSAHSVMSGTWHSTTTDIQAGRLPGFGMTIMIINGGECGHPGSHAVLNRIGFYQHFTKLLQVDPGQHLYCNTMHPY